MIKVRPPRLRASRPALADSSVSFLRQGYDFMGQQCDDQGGDVAEVRLLGRRTFLLRGSAAARLVYNSGSFHRAGALPRRAQRTLTGVGGVQSLDGAEHAHRKALFVDLLDDKAARVISALFLASLRRQFPAWERARSVNLLDAASYSLCEAASLWVGLPPVTTAELRHRTGQLRAMIESGARLGPAHWRGRLARKRQESFLAGVVGKARSEPTPTVQAPLHKIAFHTDAAGLQLPPRIAAVEVLNLLRPIVAIARYVAFAAHALAVNPEARHAVEEPDEAARRSFAHEVRRFYPFFPAIAAIASRDVSFEGVTIPEGTRVMLDLHASNHHPGDHPVPGSFHAHRYSRAPGQFDLVAQGGGDVRAGHRCPGEDVTTAVITTALGVLLDELDYVPITRSRIAHGSIPTGPAFGPILDSVRRSGLPVPEVMRRSGDSAGTRD